jgi:hypothetical protein
MRGFLLEKYFSLGIDWGIFNHKIYIYIRQDFPRGAPESPREGINNIWPVGTEDLYSVIFCL